MRAANLSVHNMSSFRGFRKIILGVIRKWSSEAALNFEFYLSDWHFRLTLFTAVLTSITFSIYGREAWLTESGQSSDIHSYLVLSPGKAQSFL